MDRGWSVKSVAAKTYRVGPILLLAIVAMSMVALCMHAEAQAEGARILSSDLAFHFVCKDRPREALENDIDTFLRREGFKVLNRARIQREHNIFVFDLDIVGIDEKRRMIAVTSLPPDKNWYTVRFRTPPPTQRASDIENALLKFVSDDLRCETRHVSRGENGADAVEFYDRELKAVENMFREADQLEGKRHL